MKYATLILFILTVFFATDLYAARIVLIDGEGGTQREAVTDGLRNALEQVLGVYITSSSQVKNAALQYDVTEVNTTGFIKSYSIETCSEHSSRTVCTLRVEVEGDETKIAQLLRKLLGGKTVSLDITATVNRQPDSPSIFLDTLGRDLINAGYYIVKPSVMPFYRIQGVVDAGEASSKYADARFTVMKLLNMRVSLIDKNDMEIAVFISSDAKRCIGSGSGASDAAQHLFGCIADDLARKFIPIIRSKIQR